MAWRNKGAITGTNNIPLGPRKRIAEDESRSESPGGDTLHQPPNRPSRSP